METLKKYTNCVEETQALGKKIGENAKENMVIIFEGDLGAGKTTLTQGIALGLGIEKKVTSPTFTILKIYEGRLKLYHIDAYRLEGIVQDLGFEELLEDDGLTVIEWAEYVPHLVPDEHLLIQIHFIEDDKREFIFQAFGKQYEELLEEIQ